MITCASSLSIEKPDHFNNHIYDEEYILLYIPTNLADLLSVSHILVSAIIHLSFAAAPRQHRIVHTVPYEPSLDHPIPIRHLQSGGG